MKQLKPFIAHQVLCLLTSQSLPFSPHTREAGLTCQVSLFFGYEHFHTVSYPPYCYAYLPVLSVLSEDSEVCIIACEWVLRMLEMCGKN